MANFTSQYTGEQIEQLLSSVGKYTTLNVEASGITFRQVVWEVQPTTSNVVYGIGVHPTNGQLYKIKSTNNTLTATPYSSVVNVSDGVLIISND